jgi:hypothetical protein
MPSFNLERQGSVAEYFNYMKWLACGLAVLWLFANKRLPLYLAWSALFFYCLVDDAESLRFIVGHWIASGLSWGPAFALTAQELGELAAAGIAGVILIGALAVTSFRNTDKDAAEFSMHLLPWLAALIFFGVGVDMVHAMFARMPTLSFWLGVVEDGGEMIVASVLTAIVALYAFPVTRSAVFRAVSSLDAAEPARAETTAPS